MRKTNTRKRTTSTRKKTMTDATRQPRSTKQPKSGRGSRFLAAGAAVGLSVAAVGGMSAAARAPDPGPVVPVVQRVVVPQPVQPIVIVLPSLGATSAGGVLEPTVITTPAKPAVEAPAPAVIQKTPVAESGGS